MYRKILNSSLAKAKLFLKRKFIACHYYAGGQYDNFLFGKYLKLKKYTKATTATTTTIVTIQTMNNP